MTTVTVPEGGTFKFGSTDFTGQVISARAVPTRDETRIATLSAAVRVYGATDWALELRYLQDWTTNGISKYLWDNRNTAKTFEYVPIGSTTPKISGTVTIPPNVFGGDSGAPLEDSLLLPITGTPTLG